MNVIEFPAIANWLCGLLLNVETLPAALCEHNCLAISGIEQIRSRPRTTAPGRPVKSPAGRSARGRAAGAQLGFAADVAAATAMLINPMEMDHGIRQYDQASRAL